MTKYSDIEIQTAKRLRYAGYKWLARTMVGNVVAFSYKPHKKGGLWLYSSNSACNSGKVAFISGNFAPFFQSIKWVDDEPTYIEDIIKPQILDDAERRYLREVIRPFRDKVRYISKVVDDIKFMTFKQGIVEGYTDCHLFIRFADASDDMSFPTFCEGEMYEGMERNKWYTLEELGL